VATRGRNATRFEVGCARRPASRPPLRHARLHDCRPNWRALEHRAGHTMMFVVCWFCPLAALQRFRSVFWGVCRADGASR
jgi:hypothetical protein